jgi:diguanylate cyclase (GGDEF)-like protein/PAS domain S-box-containing protein
MAPPARRTGVIRERGVPLPGRDGRCRQESRHESHGHPGIHEARGTLIRMNRSEPLHLIIADPSENVAEELVSELRNAGYATRAQHIDAVEDLDAVITRKRWDLMVVRREADMPFDVRDLIARVRQNELDFPILLLENGTELERLNEGLVLGATDVLLEGEDERFMRVLARELENLAQRRGRRHAELAMKESERRNQLLLDSSRAAIAYVHEGMHIYANRAYVELFGYPGADEVAGIPLLDMIAAEDQEAFKRRLREFDQEAAAEPFVLRGVREDGERFEGTMTLTMAAYDGEPCMQVLIRQEEASGTSTQELQRVRAQDPVTGLLNRPFFLESLEAVVEEARRDKGSSALLSMEIDDADRIHAEAGMAGSDNLLRDVAECLRATVGEETTLARMGDESFAAITPGLGRVQAVALGEQIRAAVEDLLASAGEKTVRLTMSIGITMIGNRTASVQEVLDQAARAVERVGEKHKAGNAVYLFDPADFVTAPDSHGAGSDDRAREVLQLLADGIKNNSLVLLYQPIVSLHGEEHQHYEVYLRLPDGDGNLLRPDEFMRLAEQAGMGGRVDRWVVLHAVKKLAHHRGEGHPARITVNLTHAALTDESFLPWLRMALKAAKLPKESVILQYSEASATTYLKHAKAFGEALRSMECLLSLSHFGCSVNPFGTLRHLQVDYVKLDGSFVEDLDSGEEKQEALREMIASLEEQGKMTVVPMVSNASVLASLFTSGANYVQGNYFAEPSPDMDYDFTSDM